MTSLRAHLPAFGWFRAFRNSSVRTGMYVGIFLSIAFAGWVIVAYRVPALDRFALPRDLAAVALLGLIALIPVLRFWRVPGNLLASSLVAWLIFSLAYRVLCMRFAGLAERFSPISAVQIFMLGAVLYMLLVTLSWLGTIIRRARASHVSHPNHHPS